MSSHARGTFEVQLQPQTDEGVGDPTVARLSIVKQFQGDLEGLSRGQMLSTRTDTQGSAGYVAMERVTATLAGRKGTFALQHFGTMTRGTPELTITVVPDSATGELTGLTGRMQILVEGGRHSYAFDYELPA